MKRNKESYSQSTLIVNENLVSMENPPTDGLVRWGKPLSEPDQVQAVWRLFEEHLLQLPSIYGRLSYLGSLATGHFGLQLVLGEEEMRRGVQRWHRQVFSEWLSMSLSRQRSDLELHFEGRTGHRKQIVAEWLQTQVQIEQLAPTDATEGEVGSLTADLTALAGLLRAEYGDKAVLRDRREATVVEPEPC